MKKLSLLLAFICVFMNTACQQECASHSAGDLLGDPHYRAVAYGGFRNKDRSMAPQVEQIREDLLMLEASGIRFIRTYHARLHRHAERVLEAISELKQEDPEFEMYVMLGCWIQCHDAWSGAPDHSKGDSLHNSLEIQAAIGMARAYPDIVKVIAVGNEAMVHWATGYYVQPGEILKWVRFLQDYKKEGKIDSQIWITSSDNFAAWGAEPQYRSADLKALIAAADYVSMHTYPFHDTHYNPEFWYVPEDEEGLDPEAQVERAMHRALKRAQSQYAQVKEYLREMGVDKEVHIGETGWASEDNDLYGAEGSAAAGECKQALYHRLMREWTDSVGISCFFFEAFDEPWKDQNSIEGSENHFGLFDVEGQVKMALWDEYEKGSFQGLGRDGKPVKPSHAISRDSMCGGDMPPPYMSNMPVKVIHYPENTSDQNPAQAEYSILPSGKEHQVFPSSSLKLNPWDGSCQMRLDANCNCIEVVPGAGEWWGGALELSPLSDDLSAFENGYLRLEVKGRVDRGFHIWFLSGHYGKGNQKKGQVYIKASELQ